MSNANKDDNNVPTLIAPLKSNPTLIKRILGESGKMRIIESSITTTFPTNAPKDDNDVSCLVITSEADGTPMVAASDSNGKLLVIII